MIVKEMELAGGRSVRLLCSMSGFLERIFDRRSLGMLHAGLQTLGTTVRAAGPATINSEST